MAMIGSAVGLGNIWRFPYILYSNGGGSFMIPYIVALVLLGFSFLFVEYAVGYRFKTSVVRIYRSIKEKYEYIAWAVLLMPFMVITYYTCIVGWDLIYFLLSFTKQWGTNPDAFFTTTVLHASGSMVGFFDYVPGLIIAILVIWLIIWAIIKKDLNKGIATVNKILLPALCIIVVAIVIFSLTLPGASIGYTQLISPDWNALLDLNVWLAAFGQILFSLSLGFATVMTYASYLPEESKLSDNALIVGVSNSAFEVFNAIGVFSILGFMTATSGIQFNSLITEGTGLAFVVYPQVFNLMGLAADIIAPLFFISILFAGITSAVSMTEPLSDAISVKFGIDRKKASTIICIIGLIISLVLFSNSAGTIVLGAIDTLINNFALIILLIAQCLILTWVYNFDNLIEIINKTSTVKLGKIWKCVIKYVLPIIMTIFCINGIYTYILTADFLTLVLMGITALMLIIVPIILTKAPAKTKEFYEPLE